MKIIGINNPRTSYYVGGAEMVSMEHAKVLANYGCSVYFFTINPLSINRGYSEQYLKFKQSYKDKICFIEIDMSEKSNIIYEHFKESHKPRWYSESIFYNRELYKTLLNTDVIFDAMVSYLNLDALVIPEQKIKSNILYLCGIPEEESLFRFSFLAMYDKIVAITKETKDYWQKYSLQPISIVYTGVDTERFIMNDDKDKNKLHILFLGRLIERKGCHVLLKALSNIPADILQHISVDIVGDGPSKQKIVQLVNKYNLSNIANIHGETSMPELFLKNSDIAVFPSLYGEGLQGVILESMSAGVCVIATDTNMNKKLLGSNRGFLIKANDHKDISKKILFCFNNRNLVVKYGRNAHNYVAEKYSWTEKTKQLLGGIL